MSESDTPIAELNGDRPLHGVLLRWWGLGAFVCAAHGGIWLALSMWMDRWREHESYWQPHWLNYFPVTWKVTLVAFLLAAILGFWRIRFWRPLAIVISWLAVIATINQVWFDRLFNSRGRGLWSFSFEELTRQYEVLHFQLVAILGWLLHKHRTIHPAQLVRWTATAAAVCGIYWCIAWAPNGSRNVYMTIRWMSRPSTYGVGEALMLVGGVWWLVAGVRLRRKRATSAAGLLTASICWAIGAAAMSCDEGYRMLRRFPLPQPWGVTEAYSLARWYLWGWLFAAFAVATALRHDVRAALAGSAARGFAPLFPKAGDVAPG